ncbi:MAG: hypothetical protein MPN21_27570 [Thermoanaerobaculia bacterium]|nr:hypothetical protein [Thermoanaerobaculia bacterium]
MSRQRPLWVRWALYLVSRTCRASRAEEIQGDLLELHARRSAQYGAFRAGAAVLWEAALAAVGRPSRRLLRTARRYALALGALGLALAYGALIFGSPGALSPAVVVLASALELLFWLLLLTEPTPHVEARS